MMARTTRSFSQHKLYWQPAPQALKLCADYERWICFRGFRAYTRRYACERSMHEFRVSFSNARFLNDADYANLRSTHVMMAVAPRGQWRRMPQSAPHDTRRASSSADRASHPAPRLPATGESGRPPRQPRDPAGAGGPAKSRVNTLITKRFPELTQPKIEWLLQRTFGERGDRPAEG
jgi:hypothetical protein